LAHVFELPDAHKLHAGLRGHAGGAPEQQVAHVTLPCDKSSNCHAASKKSKQINQSTKSGNLSIQWRFFY
jgi:hypothetical protein